MKESRRSIKNSPTVGLVASEEGADWIVTVATTIAVSVGVGSVPISVVMIPPEDAERIGRVATTIAVFVGVGLVPVSVVMIPPLSVIVASTGNPEYPLSEQYVFQTPSANVTSFSKYGVHLLFTHDVSIAETQFPNSGLHQHSS